jgi:hypothetical protein
MRRTSRIALTAVAVLVLIAFAGAGYMVFQMGPRNAWGLLRYDQRQEGSLKVGDRAPDVALVALDGASRVRLAERIGGRPLVLTFGSFT